MSVTSSISNLDLGAFLVARGLGLLRLQPDADGKRCLMVFNIAPAQLAALESNFLQGGQVSAVALLAALRQLRRAMDNLLGRNHAR